MLIKHENLSGLIITQIGEKVAIGYNSTAHFKEVGHVKESKVAQPGVSNLVLVHFHTL